MPLCFISIGSNIDREHNISSALGVLQQQFGQLQHSSIYESTAVGFAGNAFYNLVSAFNCNYQAIHIALQLKQIETDHGRIRSTEKFSSRSLDLDLLLYDQQIINTGNLKIPHPDILNYAFVLEPLAEIAPNHQHPIKKLSYAQLWHNFDKSKYQQQRIKHPLSK
ncbi:MAG: 2-amino-4-hydroxy-6-hydroxymethyldihydropteridine diphosphokinase [Methylococcaceae bacterium]|nr:2-amino-4-hydroxy-6-hydroxymethyldihydropteridine diphosphokinase [Methylococcaceae bacterium]